MLTIKACIEQVSTDLSQAKETALLDEYCDPKREAEILLCHVLGKNSAYIRAFDDAEVSKDVYDALIKLTLRRVKGEPIAYILGTKEFWSLSFKVSPATLIPRPDTEILVEAVLDMAGDIEYDVLDLGTGTGAIAIALASERRHWHITGLDISAEAIVLAKENKHSLSDFIQAPDKLKFYQSNWFERFESVAKEKFQKFDLILSNPPYISAIDEHLKKGDVRFEPLSALVSEDNGLADLKHIIEKSKLYLKYRGWLYLEHGWDQHEHVASIMQEFGFSNIEGLKDYSGHIRITRCQFLIP